MSKNKFKFFKTNHLTKEQYIAAWQEWIKQNNDEYELFAITATATAGYSNWFQNVANPKRYSDWFRRDVLRKVRTRLTRLRPNKNSTIVKKGRFEEKRNYIKHFDFFYEFGEKGSYFKSLHSAKKPHHIHGFFIIPKALTRKIWIEEEEVMSNRLIKDFNSVRSIASVLIEPIYNFKGWYIYISKGKNINDNAD